MITKVLVVIGRILEDFFTNDGPLGMKDGSVRAILAFLILGPIMTRYIMDGDLSTHALGLGVAVVAFYFGQRREAKLLNGMGNGHAVPSEEIQV